PKAFPTWFFSKDRGAYSALPIGKQRMRPALWSEVSLKWRIVLNKKARIRPKSNATIAPFAAGEYVARPMRQGNLVCPQNKTHPRGNRDVQRLHSSADYPVQGRSA
ncbi:MAG: hypothetical protein AAFY24_24900, partial [Pseudomonadota bacterium]